MSYSYDAVGNMLSKSDYGSGYQYGNSTKNLGGNAGPNAVRQVTKSGGSVVNFSYDNEGNLISGDGLAITYTSFKQPGSISRGGNNFSFSYGARLERVKEVRNGLTTFEIDKTYEKSSDGSWKLYLDDIAIISHNSTDGHKIAYSHKDRLGSSVTFTDHNGQVTGRRHYDAFGKPRQVSGALMEPAHRPKQLNFTDFAGVSNAGITRRGFTDHRHLDEVELIHMNGRGYDYNLGRFLSVDPIIQSPGNSQSLNPYSYIMNNPLAGTDPTGYSAKEPDDKEKVAVTGSRIKREATGGGIQSAGGSRVDVSMTGVGGAGNGATPQGKMTQQKQNSAVDTGSQKDAAAAQGGNSHAPLTDEQRQFAADGKMKEYWNSRHESEDPWALAGLALWDPEHSAVTDAHRDMAQVLKGRLIYEGVASGKLSPDANLNEVTSFMENVGIAVMRGHATAVQRDFTGKLGERWGVLDKYQAAVFHHKVFSNLGLSPYVYGGTPFGVGRFVPFIEGQAKLTNWFAGLNPNNKWHCLHMCFGRGYIANEDTHHDPAGR
ncbi:RHS repeat-associated protein [Rheinheimera soli]|uniref:RHS repeat-associated protein n=2 Tax=Rheinheimera soli TaxID=443616 RepID=A0ABU1W5B8_9GAMM|nr:RHS repeat-associated protein [Rheinheimera soli]